MIFNFMRRQLKNMKVRLNFKEVLQIPRIV